MGYKNVALKFNYCDGGASERYIGFNGLCSDDNMRRNVKKVKGCLKFYTHYCGLNNLDANKPPEPCGYLRLYAGVAAV